MVTNKNFWKVQKCRSQSHYIRTSPLRVSLSKNWTHMGWKWQDPVVPSPPNSRIFSRFFLTVYRILTSFLGFPHSPAVHCSPNSHISSRFSSRSTEFSHLFLFFLLYFAASGQFLVQSGHDTSTLLNLLFNWHLWTTEISHLFSVFLEEFVCPGTTSRELLVQSDYDTSILLTFVVVRLAGSGGEGGQEECPIVGLVVRSRGPTV